MPARIRHSAKAKTPHRRGNPRNGKPISRSARRVRLPPRDPNLNTVPFQVSAFAAAVFQPPAISDAAEDERVFDKSKGKPVHKSKRS